jgi:peptide/nickel transport system permease protein
MKLRYLLKRRLGMAGVVILLLVVIAALFSRQLTPHSPYAQDIESRLKPPGYSRPGSHPSLLGTDQLGRDLLSRVLQGARVSVSVAFIAVLLSSMVGTALGLYAGYYGGILDTLVMRLVDLQMAFPFILLSLAILGALGPSLQNVVIVFVVTGWPIYARTIRSSLLSLRAGPLIESARAIGLSEGRILSRYILLNCLNPLIVLASFEVGRVILLESSLSFLGLGIQPPTPSWGNMVADGRDYIDTAWWLITFPGLAIMFTVFAVNVLGDVMREYLDPRQRVQGGSS